MKKTILILISMLCLHLSAQNGWSAYIHNSGSGFMVGSETSLAIDKQGNKWLGFTNFLSTSPAAVAKYNSLGGFWTFYNSANTPVFPSNKVNAIACDTSGNVWIGTIAGLVKYDGINFTCYTTTNGLPANNILSLDCIGNMVYIGTYNGLCRYNGAIFYNYNTGNSLLDNDTVTAIKAQSPTQIWLGGNSRLTELNFNSTFTFSSYNANLLPYNSGKTNSVMIDNSGNKWMGTSLKGVIEFDNTNFNLAANTYSDLIGANFPVNCIDIAKSQAGYPIFYTTCGSFSTPSGNTNYCLLELKPKGEYQVYYVPNSNYTMGEYIETSSTGEIFLGSKYTIPSSGLIKFMYSLNPAVYNPFGQGTGGGVTNKNFKYLDINRVKAGIANRGDMFWEVGGNGNARYEVPKGSGAHSGFGKALWIGGLDASNQLHLAAQTYRQKGNDFWPGPLDTVNASCDSATFIKYDKIWKISYNDINDFITNFQNGNITNNTFTPTIDIITWPAKGNGNISRNLAPFVDVNGNGIYDPLTGGDYPRIKGDQTLYYIMNDKFAVHSETWGAPFGIEVHVMAYAFGCPNFLNGKNELAYTTFYNYRVVNRSNNNYHDMKIGTIDDLDLGNYLDDFIGCHVQSNLGFSYNADGFDEINSGVPITYLNYPPACGSTFLKGPLAQPNDLSDNDNDGLTDEIGEQCLLNNFSNYYINSTLARSAPTNPNQYFNYMNSMWRDSSFFTCGGNAYGGTTPAKFIYPWTFYTGMPCSIWPDGTDPKGDRRFLTFSGPFNLNAGQSFEFEFAQVWAVDSSMANNNVGAVDKLINETQKVRNFFYSGTQSSCLPDMAIGINESVNISNGFEIYPNPANRFITLRNKTGIHAIVELRDLYGKLLMKSNITDFNSMNLITNDLSSGIYFVYFYQNNLKSVKKFVKE